MNKTFYTFSFGCRVNQAEKEEMDKNLINNGFSVESSNPSLYIINTCAVTKKAEREVRQLIYQLKRKHPQSKIIITGCSATYWQKNSLYKKLPIDMIVNNLNKEFLTKIIINRFFEQPNRKTISQFQTNSDKYQISKRYLLKIQDGCHRFCSYCIIPYLRGSPKSFDIKTITNKVKAVEDKINEVILTAINTEAFGKDNGENFTGLIKSILDRTNIKRLSFGSIHPWSIDNKLIDFYKNNHQSDRLVSYFHIPLQSGSNKILALMKRDYKKEEILEKINALYKINPYIYFGTDIIVGFLEETDQDFEETYKFLEDSPISKFHLFRFSKRNNTAAFYMSKKIYEPSSSVKKFRLQKLQKLGLQKYLKFQEKHLNKNFQAMFMKSFKENLQLALLDNQMPAFIKTKKDFTGGIKNVKINSIKKDYLFGEII